MPAGSPQPIFKHPAALLDLLESGTGIREYMRYNRDHLRQMAPYYGEAAAFIQKWLPLVPLLDPSPKGGDAKKAANQIGRRLKMAQQLQLAAARNVQQAGVIYVRNWGDPSQRNRPRRQGINADR